MVSTPSPTNNQLCRLPTTSPLRYRRTSTSPPPPFPPTITTHDLSHLHPPTPVHPSLPSFFHLPQPNHTRSLTPPATTSFSDPNSKSAATIPKSSKMEPNSQIATTILIESLARSNRSPKPGSKTLIITKSFDWIKPNELDLLASITKQSVFVRSLMTELNIQHKNLSHHHCLVVRRRMA